jgi:hypothetical protein
MASYDPPNGYISGTYNPTYYNNLNSSSTGISADESNTFTALQYCTATMPDSTDSSTIIPTTAWVQSALPTTAYNPIIYTSTTSNTNTWTFTLPSTNPVTFGYAFDWYFTPYISGGYSFPMNAYLSATESYPWFNTSEVGYSYGTSISTSVDISLFSIKGIGVSGMVQNGNNVQYVGYAWQISDSLGTNSVTITPQSTTVNNAYSTQVTFTLESSIPYGVKLTIFPKVF